MCNIVIFKMPYKIIYSMLLYIFQRIREHHLIALGVFVPWSPIQVLSGSNVVRGQIFIIE
jgi:hypothetical protein